MRATASAVVIAIAAWACSSGSGGSGGSGSGDGAGERGAGGEAPRPSQPGQVLVSVGQSAEVDAVLVERQVAVPLEQALSQIPAVEHLRSTSTGDRAVVRCTLRAGSDLAIATESIRSAVTAALRTLPPEVEPPLIRRADDPVGARFVMRSPDATSAQLAGVFGSLVGPGLERVPGVRGIETCGLAAPIVRVMVDPARMNALGIDLIGLRAALSRDGSLVGGSFATVEELAGLPIPGGRGKLRLSDLAMVERGVDQAGCAAMTGAGSALSVAVRVEARGSGEPVAIGPAIDGIVRQLPPGYVVERFPPGKSEVLELLLEAPPGTQAEAMRGLAAAVARALAPEPGVAAVIMEIGGAGGAHEPADDSSIRALVAVDPGAAGRVIAAASKTPGVSTRIMSGAPGEGRIQLVGGDLEELGRAAQSLSDAIRSMPGVAAAGVAGAGTMPRIDVKPDAARMADVGLSSRDLAGAVAVALGGAEVAVFYEAGMRIPIRLELVGSRGRLAVDALDGVRLRSSAGAMVPLSAVATVQLDAGPQRVLRIDRQRAIEVWLRPAVGHTLDQVMAEARRGAGAAELPAGVQLVP